MNRWEQKLNNFFRFFFQNKTKIIFFIFKVKLDFETKKIFFLNFERKMFFVSFWKKKKFALTGTNVLGYIIWQFRLLLCYWRKRMNSDRTFESVYADGHFVIRIMRNGRTLHFITFALLALLALFASIWIWHLTNAEWKLHCSYIYHIK